MKKLLFVPFVCLASLLFAADYDFIVAGGETQYEVKKEIVIKVVQTIAPVGVDLATKNGERIFISSITSDEITIGYHIYTINDGNDSTATESGISLGRCKINSEIAVRVDNTKEALRIKLLSVNMDNGTCTIIVTKFWPWPNTSQTKEVALPTNPEAEPGK